VKPDEPGGAGSPGPGAPRRPDEVAPGRPPGPSEEQLRSDERAAIAWFHHDAAAAGRELADRTEKVARLVEQFGPTDSRIVRLRTDLRRLTRLTCRLFDLQFGDLA
jgi:hypothetical protein